MTTITTTTNKDEMASHALELIDAQDSRISELSQKLLVLKGIAVVLFIWNLMF